MQNRSIVIIIIAFLVLLIGSIGGFLLWENQKKAGDLQKVRQGVERSVVNLPILQDFDTIQVKFESFPISPPKQILGNTCYYGRATIMLGTNQHTPEALDDYVGSLLKAGWVVQEPQYPTSKVLRRGIQEQMNVISREPALALRQYMDAYSDAKNRYTSILFVLLDYTNLNDTGC